MFCNAEYENKDTWGVDEGQVMNEPHMCGMVFIVEDIFHMKPAIRGVRLAREVCSYRRS